MALRETSALSTPYKFRIRVAGMLLCSYVCDSGEAYRDCGSFCDIPAGLFEIGDPVHTASGAERSIVQILSRWKARGPASAVNTT